MLRGLRPKGAATEDTSGFASAEDINALYLSSEPTLFLELSVSAREGSCPQFKEDRVQSDLGDPAAKYVTQRLPRTDLGNGRINEQIRTWSTIVWKIAPNL